MAVGNPFLMMTLVSEAENVVLLFVGAGRGSQQWRKDQEASRRSKRGVEAPYMARRLSSPETDRGRSTVTE